MLFRSGWVFEPALSENAVAPGSADFLKPLPDDASTATSAGAKAIYPQAYAQQRGFDYSAVTWIEQNQPTAAEFHRFVKDGGLAPVGGRE